MDTGRDCIHKHSMRTTQTTTESRSACLDAQLGASVPPPHFGRGAGGRAGVARNGRPLRRCG